MYRLSLINMPFANAPVPSLALLQLDQLVREGLSEQVSSRVLHLNQDVAEHFGLDFYMIIADSSEANLCGLGDWLFRKIVFPETEQDVDRYLKNTFRFIGHLFPNPDRAREVLLQKRRGLDALLDRLIDRYRLAEDDMVGFTSVFCQNMASFAMAKKLKTRKPEICTLMGGANCETPMGQEIVKNVPCIDFVFSGPALKSFPQFVAHRAQGENLKCEAIKGVFSKRNVLLQVGPVQDAIGEELPITQDVRVDYRPFLQALKIRFANAPKPPEPILFFETSRGCWWGERAHCTFCGLNGSNMKYRSVESDMAVSKFEQLFDYWPQVRRFVAVDNIMPKTFVKDVLPRIAPPPDARIFYEVKADLTRDDLEALAKARIIEIQPGIESLATSTLKLMKKGVTAYQNVTFLKNCLATGVNPVWNVLVGFPGEPEEVFMKYLRDFPKLTHLPPPSGVFPVRFDRYSPYHVKAAEYGLELSPSEHYRMLYPFGEKSLQNMAYFFEDKTKDAPYADAVYRWWGKMRQEVSKWRMRWDNRRKQTSPRLTIEPKHGEFYVVDTRNLVSVEFPVTPQQVAVLEFLSTVRRVADVVREFGMDAEADVMFLDDKGLLFTEEGRYLSLVMPSDIERQSEWRSLGEIMAGVPA
ncbi:MAG TPA: RiPP maturation radical SAM C-methyltransferase [Bryobacteraceae bacterium]|jgi:ribosomal peptide maturation radical SAM protein 1